MISADDLRKTINPSDSDLEAFFKKNAARYAQAVPEERKIAYFAFTANQFPAEFRSPASRQIQQYYNEHQSDYSVPEQARSRHILISVPDGADAKTDAAAKAKAEMILKQLQAGGSWTALAKKYSDDPGSKDTGGELGFAQRGKMVPAFDKAIFTQKIGDIDDREEQLRLPHRAGGRAPDGAHAAAERSAVRHSGHADRQASRLAQQQYAQTLTSEAIKNGLEKTAAAHHLDLVTTQPVGAAGRDCRAARQHAASCQSLSGQAGRSAAVRSHGRRLRHLPGHGHRRRRTRPRFADWKTHVLDDYRNEQLPALLSQKTKELADKAKAINDLAKAAKAVGATVKTSDLVGGTGQVPDFGEVGQVAPQLFDMNVGAISGPIDAGRTGVVAKIVDKQEPTADEIAKNFDQTRDQLLDERRNEAFSIFMSGVWNDYKKHNLIRSTPRLRDSRHRARKQRIRCKSEKGPQRDRLRAFLSVPLSFQFRKRDFRVAVRPIDGKERYL